MKRIFSILLSVMLLSALAVFPASALDILPIGGSHELVVDEAGVLTPDELAFLNDNAKEIQETYHMDTAVVIVSTLDGKSAMDYADDYYDYNGYGYGSDADGVLFLLAVEDREYWISCYTGGEAISQSRRDAMTEHFLPYLQMGDWGGAAASFLRDAEAYLEKDGTPPHVPAIFAPISLVLGYLFSAAPLAGYKAQLKQVRQKESAGIYTDHDKSVLTTDANRFLHQTVSRRPIERETRSSSGHDHTAHTSSSGRTHTGSGGKF